MATFSERLKELRKSRHLSQRELADKMHISKSAVSMYESGQREPDHKTLEEIADYFNVDIDYLLGRKDTTHRFVEMRPCDTMSPDYILVQKINDLDADNKKIIIHLIELMGK